jgi:hypothetical protein
MPQYSSSVASLQAMQSRVMLQRPGLDRNLAVAFLNERMRQVINRKPNWSSLLQRTIISIPQSYTAGTVQFTTGSTTVIGTGTNWPVSDVVNTTIQETIKAPMTTWVTPASLTGITRNTLLYVDAGGPYPEIVPVLDILQGHIQCPFAYPHTGPFTATASSLSNLQLRVNSINPIFTVNAITSPTTLVMDNAWGQTTSSGNAYELLLIYTPISPNTTLNYSIKELVSVCDPFQGIALRLQVSQEELNMFDPERTSTNSPICIANLGPNLNGNMLYEVYPPQDTPYQLNVLFHAQWPDMRLPSDMPPPFMSPNCLIMGALADAFRTPCPRPPEMKDPFFSPETAVEYERRFNEAVIEEMNADESKYQRAFEWNFAQTFGGLSLGSNWNQSHSLDAFVGDY